MLRKAFLTFTDKSNNVIKRTYAQQWKKPFDSVDNNAYEVIEYNDFFNVKSEATNQLHIAPANHNGLEMTLAVDNSAMVLLSDMLDPAKRQIAGLTIQFYSSGVANSSDPSKPANMDFAVTYKQPQLQEFRMQYSGMNDNTQSEKNTVKITVLAPSVQYKWTNGNIEANYGNA
jgi:hypothetical protein